MKKILLFVSVLATFILSGCSTSMARFTAVSTNNIPVKAAEKGDIVEGEACVWFAFGLLPIGQTNDQISTAVQNALENAKEKGYPHDALVNIQIKHKMWYAFLVAQGCTIAQGEPISVENSENATPKAQNRRSVNATRTAE